MQNIPSKMLYKAFNNFAFSRKGKRGRERKKLRLKLRLRLTEAVLETLDTRETLNI